MKSGKPKGSSKTTDHEIVILMYEMTEKPLDLKHNFGVNELNFYSISQYLPHLAYNSF